MTRPTRVACFDEWRDAARALLRAGIPPERARFADPAAPGLFDAGAAPPPAPPAPEGPVVPRRFLDLAREAVAFDAPDRHLLPYRVLWRLTRGERRLLDDPLDRDAAELRRRAGAVRHDVHRMHAFVRFRPIGDRYVAWYRPDHFVVELAAPHFVDRFAEMRWVILTPRGSVRWEDGALELGPPASDDPAADADALEALWLAYYAAVFDPSRASATRLEHHLPRRFLVHLPEAAIVPSLLDHAAARLAAAAASQPPTARFLPDDRSLDALRAAALGCRACPLWEHATRTVFGEGDPHARLVLVGEQPGDQEDRQGHPFVGPAGDVLRAAMDAIGLRREDVWLTNAVKHFKFALGADPPERSRRGLKIDKPRLHRRPDPPEVEACRPWLFAELAAIGPTVVLALGATAAASLLGRRVSVAGERGRARRARLGGEHRAVVHVTYHPSAVLRGGDLAVFAALREDLLRAARAAGVPLAPPDQPAVASAPDTNTAES